MKRFFLFFAAVFLAGFIGQNSFANNPVPASEKSFYDLSATDVYGKKIHFSQFRGKVALVVNTASECGFTPQFKELEEIFKKYANRGFVILAFPSNDFRQEKQNNDDLLKFAR
ncbi:MAG: hypothetical protein H7326_11220, partial [Bdellovibrionaceae bacterium]|nr:hypothetical protein [Pseudobdellovibrionaceae bacterium]